MKILTEKAFENEMCRARAEVEERYFRNQERDRLEKHMWELEHRIEILENLFGKSYCSKIDTDATCEALR